MRVLGVVSVVGPALILAAWGGVYVVACLLALSAGGVPLEMRYVSKGGDLVVRADSYHFDLPQNILRLERVSILEPNGRTLASVRNLLIRDVVPGRRPIAARAQHIVARLERMRDGHFRIEDYLPATQAEESKIPYRVTLEHVSLLYEDHSAGGTWKRWISSATVGIVGVGQEWAANGTAKVERSGNLRWAARMIPSDGLGVDLELGSVELAEVFAHFRRTPEGKAVPELAQMSAASLRATGTAKLAVPASGQVRWWGDVTGAVTRFAYGSDVKARHVSVFATLGADGARGRVIADAQGSSATFDGSFRWGERLRVAGTLDVQMASAAALPAFLKHDLPPAVRFSGGTYKGWFAHGADEGLRLSGEAAARSASWDRREAKQIMVAVDVSDRRVVASSIRGVWQGNPVTGALVYDLQSGAIDGHFEAPDARLGPALRELGVDTIDGSASIRAVLSGRTNLPVVVIRAEGRGRSNQPGYEADLGNFQLGGTYTPAAFSVDRFIMVGPSGGATANGSLDLKKKTAHVDLLATGVPLQSFFKEISGSAAFSGTVAGPLSTLRATGQLEVFAAKMSGQDLPFARGDVEVDGKGLQAKRVLAFKRGAQATGEGSVSFQTRKIDGTFEIQGIDLADYPPNSISGIASVSGGRLTGTLDEPALQAAIQANHVAAYGVAMDRFLADATLSKGIVTINNASATTESGSITGSGVLSMTEQSGSFSLQGTALPLRSLLAQALKEVSISGLLDGKVAGRFDHGTFQQVDATGDLTNLKVNEAFLGSGPVTLKTEGSKWVASVFLGDTDSYLEAPAISFDPESKTVDGDVVSDNLKASILYDSLSRYLVDEDGRNILPDAIAQRADEFQGRVDLDGHLSGRLESLDFDIRSLTVDKMDLDGHDAGRLSAKGNRKDQVWTIDRFDWTGGPAAVKLTSGRIEEHGQIALDGEIRDLNWKWLAPFRPEFAKVEGRSDIPFLVQGQTRSPEILASASYEEGEAAARISPWPGVAVTVRNPKAKTRRVDLQNIKVAEGAIDAEGVFNVEGFTGSLEARIPFHYPLEIPDGEPISAVAKIPERQLSSLTELLPFLEPAQTNGSVSATVQLSGTRSQLLAQGSLETKAETLAIRNLKSTLTNVDLKAGFQNERVSVHASGGSSTGGTFETEDVGFSLDNLEDAFRDSFSVLLQNGLFGNFKLNGFRMDYLDRQNGLMTGVASGALVLGGTLAEPSVTGGLLIEQADLVTPSNYQPSETATVLPIDPRFDVSFFTANKIRLRASTGNFELTGAGSLTGNLSAPTFTSNLEVQKGSVRLPNARIALEQGGLVAITYRASPTGATVARVEVDMTGRTQVSAEGLSGIVERYDVVLGIRGDLLAENGLQLTAQSDPPDLSQDRILAILGQRDVFAGRPGEGFRADRQLQSALLGLAVPYFAGSFMEQVASRLGLDYINIEYNAFDQFAVTAGITLGRDLILSGRRQLSSPLPGEPPKFDLRLSYRPPFRNRALRKFTLSVGMDQDRPWKISVEYGIKF